MTSAPDGSLVVSDASSCGYPPRVRRVGPLLPAQSGGLYRIPSDDGSQVWTFDASGRHQDTREARTGGLVVSFGYESGRIATLTDGDGLVTRIERDAAGSPLSTTAPFGQVTTLAVDPNGYLSEVRNPNEEAVVLSHDGQGLLRQIRDARGSLHVFTYGAGGRLTADAEV